MQIHKKAAKKTIKRFSKHYTADDAFRDMGLGAKISESNSAHYMVRGYLLAVSDNLESGSLKDHRRFYYYLSEVLPRLPYMDYNKTTIKALAWRLGYIESDYSHDVDFPEEMFVLAWFDVLREKIFSLLLEDYLKRKFRNVR